VSRASGAPGNLRATADGDAPFQHEWPEWLLGPGPFAVGCHSLPLERLSIARTGKTVAAGGLAQIRHMSRNFGEAPGASTGPMRARPRSSGQRFNGQMLQHPACSVAFGPHVLARLSRAPQRSVGCYVSRGPAPKNEAKPRNRRASRQLKIPVLAQNVPRAAGAAAGPRRDCCAAQGWHGGSAPVPVRPTSKVSNRF